MPYSEDPLRRLRSIISRRFSKNGRIPILRDKPIELIKWGKVRLENLLVNLHPKRGIKGKG
jgi:hypothetical protein